MARRPRSRSRDYPRTARLNELLRQIIAESLERIDDDRLQLVTVISVDVDSDLHRALVYVSTLDPSTDDAVLEALAEVRVRVQGAVARQARLKRTPEVVFRIDDVLRSAARIDDLLRENPVAPEDPGVDGEPVDGSTEE
jgi:ribosome-binding factor A